MLPEGWSAATVADICSFQNGHGFGPEDWDDKGFPIIRIQNLNGGKKFDYFSGTPEAEWLVHSGQLLFAWAGTRGVSFGPTVWRGPTGVLNQHIFKVTANTGVQEGWLYWALRHVTDRVERNAHGFKDTLVHVKKSDIERQPVSVPSPENQKRISATLYTWDAAIATTERLLANSRTQKEALASRILFGKSRLAPFNDASPLRATPCGRIPAHWQYPRVEEIAHEISRRQADGAPYPVLSCTKHAGLVDSLKYFKKQVFSKDLSTYKVVPRGVFAYATNHIEEGAIGYQNLYDFALVSPIYTAFETTDRVHDGYLYRVLKTERFRQVFEAATNSSVDRRGSLRWSDFKKIHVPLPSLEEQAMIAAVLEKADSEIALLEKQVLAFRAEKSALMQQLLTGKRRVHLPAAAETAP